MSSSVKTLDRCTQCGEPILPGDFYMDEFMIGDRAPMHEECYPLWSEDDDRANFWFDYEMPGCKDCGNFRAAIEDRCPACHVPLCKACTEESHAYGHDGRCRACAIETCEECQRIAEEDVHV